MTTPLTRLTTGYYNSAPVSGANPGGMAAGGHVVNFPACLADIGAVVSDVIGGAPGALNTFAEVATALGGDPAFAATMTNALAAKAASARVISAGGLATGGGSLTADRTITVAKASGPEAVTGTADDKAVTPLALKAARDVDAAAWTLAISTAINGLVSGAPGALDTIRELAQALGDDANFAATMTNALAAKAASARVISAGGLATGGGSLTADRTITVAKASGAATMLATDDASAVTPLALAAAQVELLDAQARADLQYRLTRPSTVAAFLSRGVELDFLAARLRVGVSAAALADHPGWSFSRSTTATAETAAGVVTHFAAGAARLSSGRGLLVERAATNLVTHSQAFDDPAWTKTAGGTGSPPVVTPNAGIAPDGTMTAELVMLSLGAGDAAADFSTLARPVAGLETGASYCFSIWVKGDAGTSILLRQVGGGAFLTHVFSGAWERIRRVEVAVASTNSVSLWLRGGQGVSRSAAFYVWGAQLEAGEHASSYIPTTTAAATRAADVATLNGLSLAAPMTVLAEWERPVGGTQETWPELYYLRSASGTDAVRVYRSSITGAHRALTLVAGFWNPALTLGAAPAAMARLATAWETAGVRSSLNGGATLPLVSPVTAATLSTLQVGHSGGSLQANGWIRRLVVLPMAVSDAQLEAMSA